MWVNVAEYNINYLYRCKVTDSAGNVVYSNPAAVKTGQVTWKNTYNADGLRTQRTDGYTTYSYYYTGDKLTYMTVGDDVLRFGYDANGAPMCVQWNNSRYFYVTNPQGDVVALVSINGIPVVEYTYDAWGNILTITGTRANNLGKLNPLRYRGYIYDAETELYYLQSRYYDPQVSRFLNADNLISTGQGLLGNNMFAYCLNNPVCRKDIPGTTSVEIKNDDGNPTDDDEDIHGGKTSNNGPGKYADSSKNVRNPGGRHGGEAHRAKVIDVKKSLQSKGWEVSERESRVYYSEKQYRYPDIIAKKGNVTRYYQIGRKGANGKPVSRELWALQDLGTTGIKVYFVEYAK